MIKEYFNEEGEQMEIDVITRPRYVPETGRIHMLDDEETHISFAPSHDIAELDTPEGRAEIQKALRAAAEDSGGFLRYDEKTRRLVCASSGEPI